MNLGSFDSDFGDLDPRSIVREMLTNTRVCRCVVATAKYKSDGEQRDEQPKEAVTLP